MPRTRRGAENGHPPWPPPCQMWLRTWSRWLHFGLRLQLRGCRERRILCQGHAAWTGRGHAVVIQGVRNERLDLDAIGSIRLDIGLDSRAVQSIQAELDRDGDGIRGDDPHDDPGCLGL